MTTIDFSQIDQYINPVYRPYLFDWRYYQIYKGGGSAGKSWFIAQKIITNIVLHPGFNGVCLRKVGANNHDSTFAELRKCIEEWNMTEAFIILESKGAEEIIFRGNGNKVLFRGLDNVKKLRGLTFTSGPLIFVWIEEGDEVEESDVNQIMVRLRGKAKIPKQIYISFNPIDSDHWIKARFFDRPIDPVDGFTLSTNYLDNQYLTPEDVKHLESFKDTDEYYYQVYCLGNWGSIKNSIILHNVKILDFDINEHYYSNIRAGLDFGYIHAQALMKSGWIDGSLYLFEELWRKGIVNKDFIPLADNEIWQPYHIIAESANPDKIQEWRDSGFDISKVKKGPNESIRRMDFFQRLPNIYIHKTRCPNAAREFSRWKRRELSNGKILEEPVDINDDTITAVAYANKEFFNEISQEKKRSPFSKRRVS